jgi:hypothetical protein
VTIKQTMPHATTSTRAGWRAYTTALFALVVVGAIYNAITTDFLPSLQTGGWNAFHNWQRH